MYCKQGNIHQCFIPTPINLVSGQIKYWAILGKPETIFYVTVLIQKNIPQLCLGEFKTGWNPFQVLKGEEKKYMGQK